MNPIREPEQVPSNLPPTNPVSNGTSPEEQVINPVEAPQPVLIKEPVAPIVNASQEEVPPAPAVEPPSNLRQMRTYQGDVAHAIENQDESLFSIQQAERARMGEGNIPTPEQEEEKKNNIKGVALVVGSFLLVGAGIIGGWYSYVEYSKQVAVPEVFIPGNRLITSAQTIDIITPTSRDGILRAIAEKSSEVDLPVGEVAHLELWDSIETNELTSTEKFFQIIEGQAPGNLVRAFDPIFMIGAIGRSLPQTEEFATPLQPISATSAESSATSTLPTEGQTELEIPAPVIQTESIFIIIKVNSFENAFPGMLSWEAGMVKDIGPLFSTRELASSLPIDAQFVDFVSRNKDTRVLKDNLGRTVLIYAFFDRSTLIITDDEETLRTLLNRLTNELLSR